ncbi:sporulation inhibitor of replication SirA [Cytobacillus horneckiae]|uniref:Sporulation inhibitor of replication protein SirA n=1 Tax=Cytobacillus horneckiae TaxID=549687 RepID=A0A2N0ZD63_9BACI|nr:sporulation inhibitor of replication protein SirA [Cytobacillus horneckiae]NRG48088.1 sporulation inhibitor of replication protein SirA [Bacillus sp. CRN 9]MBN6887327.1 sporulation inhibitor of replication protein SirA [Cytobacillus horneckiae]MCM3178083.1 sporulation inhibitor of replication protein SirA [Cytobacillus horneckiae]MEC1157180.1 sporulation inhibitor of replication protein SirA [Cytobacillus horneckiae]MED2938113.1 sporulation inhibitor of replication protein SirA [Cytobacillu
MRTYQLYLIEEQFASHYFGREQMFFRLFQEYERSSGDLYSILQRQIYFITKEIPKYKVQQDMFQELLIKQDMVFDEHAYYISQKRSNAKLEVGDRFITLEASGNFEAETIFFEVLRKSESSYLAIDLSHNRFGWLKPIKERKFV